MNTYIIIISEWKSKIVHTSKINIFAQMYKLSNNNRYEVTKKKGKVKCDYPKIESTSKIT